LDIAEDKVTFRYKDYRHDAQQKTMTLEAEEFIRRFLLHVLPGQPVPRAETSTLPRNCWTCRRRKHRPSKELRIIVSVMKNSSALRCGSAQSVTKVACW
jgi:putative transposase